jgi:hypothetical protein
MSLLDLNWNTFHAAAAGHVRNPLPAEATPRPHGGLRYCCPVTGSFVLVTDAATLQWLARPNASLRCADCGELHPIAMQADAPACVVAESGKA